MTPTNFKLLASEFPDLVKEIQEGWYDGDDHEPSVGNFIKKTIHFHDGTVMHAFEHIGKDGRIVKYQYDWQYEKGETWKWHNEPHREKKHQTATEPHHQHFESRHGMEKIRLPNYGHRDLWAILESIRFRKMTSSSG